jgi:hypothetical protein
VVSDSPRRAVSPGRFGKARKEELRSQPPNSDSVTDDDAMEPQDERLLRDADFPNASDPGSTRDIIDPEEP